jgi:hypothetical protein
MDFVPFRTRTYFSYPKHLVEHQQKRQQLRTILDGQSKSTTHDLFFSWVTKKKTSVLTVNMMNVPTKMQPSCFTFKPTQLARKSRRRFPGANPIR